MGVRDGYRLMQWHAAMDGPWSPVAERRFVEEGYDGLVLVSSRDWTPRSLDFLRDLPGIRLFSLRAFGRCDSAADCANLHASLFRAAIGTLVPVVLFIVGWRTRSPVIVGGLWLGALVVAAWPF